MSRAQFYRIKAFDKLPKSVIELLKIKPRLITALSAANIAKAIGDLKAQGISSSEVEDALILCIRDSVSNGVKITNIVSYSMERLVKKMMKVNQISNTYLWVKNRLPRLSIKIIICKFA